MFAADFRKIARDALAGKWKIAIIACLIASLLGAVSLDGPELNINFDASRADVNIDFAGQVVYGTSSGFHSKLDGFLTENALYILLIALVMAVAFFILGSIVGVGYSKFNLDLTDLRDPEIGTLFAYFPNWKTAVAAGALQALLIFLGTLLLIIPGIIAGYSYAMTRYILAEHPELTATEALSRSKKVMTGSRWRLFCLQFSFIGWNILASLTLGIGNLWLNPYKQAATAAFYREISNPTYVPEGIPCEEDVGYDI